MKYFSALLLLLFFATANLSCSRQSLPVARSVYAADGKYDSGPPLQGASVQLDKISQSVYRLNVIALSHTLSTEVLT